MKRVRKKAAIIIALMLLLMLFLMFLSSCKLVGDEVIWQKPLEYCQEQVSVNPEQSTHVSENIKDGISLYGVTGNYNTGSGAEVLYEAKVYGYDLEFSITIDIGKGVPFIVIFEFINEVDLLPAIHQVILSESLVAGMLQNYLYLEQEVYDLPAYSTYDGGLRFAFGERSLILHFAGYDADTRIVDATLTTDPQEKGNFSIKILRA